MLTIQCTKKLLTELDIKNPEHVDISANPLYSWHAHTFLYNRRKCVLIMNNLTRYNFLLYGLKKADFKVLNEIVVKEIGENLLADKVNEEAVKQYLANCKTISFTTTSERSIISQINEMIFFSKIYMENDKVKNKDTNLYELNRHLNRFVMLKLAETYSGDAM